MTQSDPIPQPPPINYATPAVEVEMDSQAKTWGMACHLASLAGYFIGFGQIIGPLIVWLIYKDRFAFVDDQGKESLNFQLTTYIAVACASVFICLIVTMPLVIFLYGVIALLHLVFTIVASVQAASGKRYRYPLTLRLIK